MPRSLSDEDAASTNIKELLGQLDAQRRALETDTEKAMRDLSQGLTVDPTGNMVLKLRVKEMLARLKQGPTSAPPPVSTNPPAKSGTDKPAPVVPKDATPEVAPWLLAAESNKATGGPESPIDPLPLAHALWRSGNFEGALKAFQMVDLKGMRSEQRAPILYLIASCHGKLGKTDDAVAIYREVANIKGDEQVAACAQWQLAAIRWQRETATRLDEIRKRRQALERVP